MLGGIGPANNQTPRASGTDPRQAQSTPSSSQGQSTSSQGGSIPTTGTQPALSKPLTITSLGIFTPQQLRELALKLAAGDGEDDTLHSVEVIAPDAEPEALEKFPELEPETGEQIVYSDSDWELTARPFDPKTDGDLENK